MLIAPANWWDPPTVEEWPGFKRNGTNRSSARSADLAGLIDGTGRL